MKDETKLFVWGPNGLNNRLLAGQIREITGVTPVCINDHDSLSDHHLDGNSIVFCDCDKMDARTCCVVLKKIGEKTGHG